MCLELKRTIFCLVKFLEVEKEQYFVFVIKNHITDRDRTAFPITELISSSHNVDAISSWLGSTRLFLEDEISSRNWPFINRIITDKSFAN